MRRKMVVIEWNTVGAEHVQWRLLLLEPLAAILIYFGAVSIEASSIDIL